MNAIAQDTVQPQCAPAEVMKGVIPYLQVDGATKAAAFYQRAFGALELGRQPVDDQGRTMHIHLQINGGSLMLSDPFPEHGYAHKSPQGIDLTIIVDDIDAWWARAVGAGCEVVVPVDRMFWGDRYGQLRDPFGFLWAFNEPANRRPQTA